MSFFRSIHAESIKLRYLPIYWLVGVVIFAVLAIIFSAHFLDVNTVATLGGNPWEKLTNACLGIFSIFISVPFVVLLVSAALNVEEQANAWKYQYTLPKDRSRVFYAKLITLILIIILTIFGLAIGMILCGYLLDAFLPEMEFRYHTPPFFDFLGKVSRTFIALLGIIGIQYALSLRTRGFLVPASFGVVAFIAGVILGSTNKPMAKFFPYSHPIISRDHNMFLRDKIGVVDYGWLNNVEIFSIVCFVVVILAAHLYESRKRIL